MTEPERPQGDDLLAVFLDLALIYLFATIGRASHGDPIDFSETITTAMPFLVAALVGHVVARYTRRQPRTLRWGVLILGATWALGHAGRFMLGDAVDPTFMAVSAAFLTLFLLGWRAILLVALRFRRAKPELDHQATDE